MNSNILDIYELTPLQQGMLYHTLSTPDSTVYHIQMDFTLEGKLDVNALEQSWSLVKDRHDPLRTSFVWAGVEKPYQVVHRATDQKIQRLDWSELPAVEQDRCLRAFIDEDLVQKFDLNKPSLIRLSLITLEDRRFRFIWTFHHIILEGWSAAILAAEFWKIFNDKRSRRMLDLPPVRRYADYIAWLGEQDQGGAEAFWRDYFRGFAAPSSLPIDRADAGEVAQVVHVDQVRDTISPDKTAALRELARQNRVTLNTIVQGLWALLISRYTGETDVVFGAALSGRPPDLPGSESIVGLFVNVLPVRVRINHDARFFAWLEQLQLDQAMMRQYEYSSLMQVNSWSELPAGQPLFNTVLGFENWLGEIPAGPIAPGLNITALDITNESDQPLTLFAAIADRLSLILMYDTERFDRQDVERLLAHLRTLLESLLDDPQQRVSELAMLSENELRQILHDWNVTETDYPRDRTVPELFEAQAVRTPQGAAVTYDGQTLSYAELNDRANRLAHYLQARGVGPGSMVGVFVERGPEMVVSLLGILKAGGAYLPLDLDYPKPRLVFMLEDARVPVLLTTTVLRARLPAWEAEAVCLDSDWAEIARQPAHNPATVAGPDSLAYVIYTSGSTGQPKGVLVPHRAINRLVCDTDYFQVTAGDRVAQASNVSFDAATFEIWGALLNGARLVGIDKDILLSPPALAAFLQEQGITALFITTALFNLMAREAPQAFSSLRGVLFGGEAVDPQAVRRVIDSAPPEHLLHVYGPTESTTFASWYRVESVAANATTVPIGRPIANTRLYVLDCERQPVPVSVPGELYIGGDGLAHGYLNREQLTAEKFVADPFSKVPQSRLYRTGDRVCYRADGNIEFLGRFDHQVKIRGFRIELGEVEAAIASHPDVSQAVTIVNDDDDKGRRLFAYTTPAAESHAGADEIRQYLRQQLPEYMIPANVIWLDSMPLTPNGKIDHRALPAPTQIQKPGPVSGGPETKMEIIMARIWEEVLDIDDIEVNDMFFDLGGHSLLSIKVVEKFAEETGVRLPPVSLLNQTLRQLVADIEPAGSTTDKEPGRSIFGVLKNNIKKRG